MATKEVTPDLNTTIRVSENQIDAFRRDGHVMIPGILNTGEIAYFRKLINETTAANNTETRELEDRDTYGKAFIQVMNLWKFNPALEKFTLARRFGKIAADLLGVDRVRLYHDQALYKEPGGGPTPWHQDQYYWPLDTPKTVTMWMPLVDISEDMGMLTFASESQHESFAENVGISDESETRFQQRVEEKGLKVSREKTMRAGDATWHYGWTFHTAPGNASDKMREVVTIIFFADGAKVIQPRNPNQEADLAWWLGSLPAGSPAASELNPIVFDRG